MSHLKSVDNVTILPVVTSLDIPVERVLDGARDALLASAIVIGYTPDGEFWFASSVSGGPSVLWDLEKAKIALLNVTVDGGDD